MRFWRSGPPSGGTRNGARSPVPLRADAIVVLGCSPRPNGRLRRRVALGALLYKSGVAPLMLLSGGTARAEAEAMREMALAAGVPEAALLLEPSSRNTAENALYTAQMLHARGLRRIVLVSDPEHLFRASLLFRLVGFDVVGLAGAPSKPTLRSRLLEAAALPRSVVRVVLRRQR